MQDEVETCPLEDWIINRSKKLPTLILIHGEPQMGKSTLFNFLANNISLLKFKDYWDYKTYCARSLQELIDNVKKYKGQILGYEESEREISTAKWYDDFAQLYALMLDTQGFRKNIIVMVQPCGLTIPNRHRRMINLGLEVLAKDEDTKTVYWKNTVYDHQNWRLDESFIWYNHLLGSNWHTYTKEELERAAGFTDWLIEAKEVIMNDILSRSKRLNSIEFKKNPPAWVYDVAAKVGIDIE